MPRTDNIADRFFGYSSDSVVMLKVDLLRNASYSTTNKPLDTLHLWGSVSNDTVAVLMALPRLEYVYWNGDQVEARPQGDNEWFYVIPLPGPNAGKVWSPPKLSDVEWKWADSLPEASAEFDDSEWVKAEKTSSFNPYSKDPSLDTQGLILFASEYGFHGNNILWKGRFTSHTTAPKDIFIKVEAGRFSAFSAYLNGVYLGSAEAGSERNAGSATFAIPDGTLKGGENVVTVLQDHMGIDMETGTLSLGLQDGKVRRQAPKLPRGITAFSFPSLRKGKIEEPKVKWRVQGNFKGEDGPDNVRRYLNEGGLHAEVAGWHLPGYDASSWPKVGEGERKGRVTFYRTTFTLDAPNATDIGLSFHFRKSSDLKFRAQLYVNGWQMGKYINNLGPQTRYPVHSGIVNLNGENEVGVSVWNLDEDEEWEWDPREGLELEVAHVMSGGSRDGYVLDGKGWEELRG